LCPRVVGELQIERERERKREGEIVREGEDEKSRFLCVVVLVGRETTGVGCESLLKAELRG
jgi:hypothetical protein